MDTRTGNIASMAQLEKDGVPNRYVMKIDENKLTKEQRQTLKNRGRIKIGRNMPCPCGSGLKFKRCCINKKMY